MSDRARWQRIQALFDELADAPTLERSSRLAVECAEDPQLRASVESLLANDKANDDLLGVIGNAADDLLEQYDDRLVGTRVGAYELKSVIGKGGMSTVYAAKRADAQYEQTVAVKVVHQTSLHPRLRARLRAERHILATLDHPCIARLIDSGEMEDGAPYLVMEYVDGISADVYCDSHTLFIRERLELFLQICAAVQFAHRNLVVHRDIKPANILVTESRAPKLLDFGIAKLLAPDSLSHTVPVTRLQERILTPENAAPEQVLGRPITTATDVYALGVLLYQLLTGRSPYRLQSYSQLQLERAICMDEPLRPSQAIRSQLAGETNKDIEHIAERRGLPPDRLRKRLAGDLDAIVGMAMRKEPALRYASADALADDIRRHLASEPVLARQGDKRYRAVKFMRRHAMPLGLAAAAFVLMAGVAGLTLFQNHRIEQARQATAEQRDHAQQVSAFMVDVFAQADPYQSRGREPSARELLDRGAAKIMAELDTQPEVRAQLLESIGISYRRLGFADRAVPPLERALEIRRRTSPPDPKAIVAALSNLGDALFAAGQIPSAESNLQQALALAIATPSVDGTAKGTVLKQLGQLTLTGKGEPDLAIQYFNRALSLFKQQLGAEAMVAAIYDDIAIAASWKNDFVSAERSARKALAIYQTILNSNHPDRAIATDNLGSYLVQQGKLAEAEPLLLEALANEKSVLGATHPRVAGTLRHLGSLYERRGDYRRAIETTRGAVEIARANSGEKNYLTGYYLDALANLLFESGNLPAADINMRRALSIFAATLQPQHLYIASSRQTLGEILLKEGDPAGAEAEFRRALEINRRTAGEDSWRAARSQASLGWTLILRGDAAQGEPLLVQGRERLASQLGVRDRNTVQASNRLIEYYRSRHRDADAACILGATKCLHELP
jgi:serine/threonine protein kinase/Tfp pilus assembly protein PilF